MGISDFRGNRESSLWDLYYNWCASVKCLQTVDKSVNLLLCAPLLSVRVPRLIFGQWRIEGGGGNPTPLCSPPFSQDAPPRRIFVSGSGSLS